MTAATLADLRAEWERVNAATMPRWTSDDASRLSAAAAALIAALDARIAELERVLYETGPEAQDARLRLLGNAVRERDYARARDKAQRDALRLAREELARRGHSPLCQSTRIADRPCLCGLAEDFVAIDAALEGP